MQYRELIADGLLFLFYEETFQRLKEHYPYLIFFSFKKYLLCFNLNRILIDEISSHTLIRISCVRRKLNYFHRQL